MCRVAEKEYFNSMQIAKPILFSFFVLHTKWQRSHDIPLPSNNKLREKIISSILNIVGELSKT
jgi:hypothetical protein